MSEDTKTAKEQRCRELLKANPDVGMKEANLTIREEFGAGVSPPVFSRIKKELNGDASSKEISNDAKAEPVEKEEKKKTSSKKEEKKSSPIAEQKDDSSQASEKTKPDSSESSSDDDSRKDRDQNKHEEPAPPPEEEIDPNLPKFPVHLEILAPTSSAVHLAGSFNRWKIDEYPLVSSGEGFWVFDGELPQGEWHYKFVLDGRIWYLDIHKKKVTDRTGVSHLIQVGDPIPKEDAAAS